MRLSDIAKRITKIMGVLLLVLIAASALYYRSFAFLPFALGALLGVGVSIAKVWLLDRAVDRVMRMDKKNAGGYVYLQYLLRFLLTGLALLLAVLVPFLSIWGMAAGVCTLQIATFFTKKSSGAKDGVTGSTESNGSGAADSSMLPSVNDSNDHAEYGAEDGGISSADNPAQ